MKAFILALLITTPALAADDAVCTGYATKSLDQVMKYMWLRLYATCMAVPETPAVTWTWDELQHRINDPAQLPDVAPPAPKASSASPPKTKVATASTGGVAQSLCDKFHKRTVYTGKHWNCR
jgi:hypothetical protein